MGAWMMHAASLTEPRHAAQHIRVVECCVEVHAEGSKASACIGPGLTDGALCRHAVVLGFVDFLEFDLDARLEVAGHDGHYQWSQRLGITSFRAYNSA